MNIIGILHRRQAIGRATLPYPSTTALAAAARGAPELNVDLCVGSGICAQVCPAHALQVDRTLTGWTWRLDLGPCVGCGLCIEACPQGALTASPMDELAARDRADLVQTVRFHDAALDSLGERT